MKLLLFVSPGCSHCPDAERVAKKISPEYYHNGLAYKKIRTRTSEGKELSKNYNIRGVPTIILADDEGNELKRIVGAPSENVLRSEIEKHLGLRKSLFKKLFGGRK